MASSDGVEIGGSMRVKLAAQARGGCPRRIAEDDQGLIVSDAQTGRSTPWHLECWRPEPVQ